MGITDLLILDLVPKVRSWINILLDSVSPKPALMSCCYECRAPLPGAGFGHGLLCQSCRRMFCRKCMAAGSGPGNGGQPRFCSFCFHAITATHLEGGSEGLELVPDSPLLRFGNIRLAQLVESQHFSSPRSLGCSTCRSDEEDDADHRGKRHFFSPSSEFSQDVSDVDSISISTGHDLYSFKSVNSSPLDSPTRVDGSGDNSPGRLDQEALGYFRKSGADSEDLLEGANDPGYDNVSVYQTSESHQKAPPPLDFNNDWRIWEPPPPEDENDDLETGLFRLEDEDDDVGGSGMGFSSASFGNDAFVTREKPGDANKEHLRDAFHVHFRALVSQLLKGEGLPVRSENGREGWLEIVSSLACQAATFVKPDTSKGGSMDPGDYVKVKCILSGKPSDSTVVKGVVCTKNVKHKRMVTQHKNPRLFLLGGSLEYQKVPNKLASIDTVLEQEIDHLKMSVAKIEAHRPNVLLVEKSVSSHAQEYLLTKEISLVLNVKRKLLERISRCTGAQIAPSIDNLSSARLGQCEMFRVEKVSEQCSTGNHLNKKSVKTLMYFQGCPRRLGCTVLLRGTNSDELKKVKHLIRFASFAAYHLSHETSFLEDEGATLPKIPLKPLMATPATMMNAGTCISKTSASTSANKNRTITGGRVEILEVNSEKDACTSSYHHFTSGGISYLSSADDLLNGDFASESNSMLSLCGSERSRSTLQCKEPCASSHCPSDVNLVDDSFTEKRNSANHQHLREAYEQTDTDDGSEIPSEYLTPDNHQSILVSLSSTSVHKGIVCEPSRIFRIKFYGSFDKPIGRYLLDDLFDQTSLCQFCKEPSEAHVQCYTHQNGSLTISVRQLPSMKLSGEKDGRIWMWHRCLKCEPKDGIPPAARRVVMSDPAWDLSFGKFLDLSFSNHATANRVASCGHSLQKDCLRFYGLGRMVAFFRYSPVDILSVQLPPLVLDFTCQIHQDWARTEAVVISNKLEVLHSEIFDVLRGIEQKIMTSEHDPIKASIHKYIMELKDLLARERNNYDVLLQSAAAGNGLRSQTVDIFELNRLRRCLLIDSYTWDRRLCLLDSFSKSRSSTSKLCPKVPEVVAHNNLKEWRAETVFRDVLGNSSGETIIKSSTLSKQHEEASMQVVEGNSSCLVEMDLSIESVGAYVGSTNLNLVSGQCYRGDERQIGAEACIKDESSSFENLLSPGSNLSDKIDLAWTGIPEAESVGSLSLMDNPFYRKVMSPVRVNSFDSALRFRDRIHGGLSPASLHLTSVKSFDNSGILGTTIRDSIPNSPLGYSQRSPRSVKRLSFFPSHSPTFISSTSHMVSDGARLLLPQTGPDNVVTVLYDNEPTTIISHAINSQVHADFISCKLDQHEGLSENERISGSTGRPSISQFQLDEEPQPFRGNPSMDSKESHFRISFDDESSIPADRVKFSVTCYFAKQFDALRKKCCRNEVDFLCSLNRCKRWNAHGGKSNVYFAKSFDERFVIKQVTRTELVSFEEFAPHYFTYLMESINSGSPTCLAKVFGIYQVTVKHLKGGREEKMDFMVMENLFFGRSISRVYDLKGSSRARYNPDTSGNNVLLDLNLLEALRTKPIFLTRKAKRSLERAVWNDTAFLASIDVMDYSLLVGVDEKRKELVIGIIDFMRQYTWDKHLETWVKASGILGGPKNAIPNCYISSAI